MKAALKFGEISTTWEGRWFLYYHRGYNKILLEPYNKGDDQVGGNEFSQVVKNFSAERGILESKFSGVDLSMHWMGRHYIESHNSMLVKRILFISQEPTMIYLFYLLNIVVV